MNLHLLEIPDTPGELATWLERRFVDGSFVEFIAELEAVGPGEDSRLTLDQIVGEREEILARGLTALPEHQLRQLARSPDALVRLQEEALFVGGEYWRTMVRDQASADSMQSRDDSWAAISEHPDAPAVVTPEAPQTHPRNNWGIVGFFVTAAAILICVFVFQTSRPQKSGWGWNKDGALSVNLPPDQYLMHLADAANEWFNKEPSTREDLRTRLAAFRKGCQALIEAPHPQLADSERTWLVGKCKAWATKLDEHLAAIDQGDDLSEVRNAANETVGKLISALRRQAESVAAA